MPGDSVWVVWDGKRIESVVLVATTEQFARKYKKEVVSNKKLKVEKMGWDKAFLFWHKLE